MSDNEELEVDSEMAAAMGFSSFGAVPSTKRRKYNHNDAVVDASIAPNLSIRGSNALPLGQKRVPAQLPSMIASEDNAAEAVIEANENAAEAADVAGAREPLPSKHSAATASVLEGWDVAKQGARQYSVAELAALREGVTTLNEHIAYFLPSFVEDPWEQIESRRVAKAR